MTTEIAFVAFVAFITGCCVGIAPWHWLARKNERLAREVGALLKEADLLRAEAKALFARGRPAP